MPTETASVESLQALLRLQDSEFIEKAYLSILGRKVDPTGLDYSLGKLRNGVSKLTIIADLRHSTEGRSRPAKVNGLDKALKRHRLCNMPFIGAVFRAFWRCESEKPSDRHLRAILNELGRLRQSQMTAPPSTGPARLPHEEDDTHAQVHAVMATLGPQARKVFARLSAQISSS